jgi:hypothetical protein
MGGSVWAMGGEGRRGVGRCMRTHSQRHGDGGSRGDCNAGGTEQGSERKGAGTWARLEVGPSLRERMGGREWQVGPREI